MMTSEAPHALAVNRHTRPMGPGGEKGRREGEEGRSKWSEEEREIDREEGGKDGGREPSNEYIQVWLLHNQLMV